MRLIRSTGEMQEAAAALRRGGRRLALVPTMGALHAGHLRLLERARAISDAVVASLFVNPAQFAAGEDFERYPRTFEADSQTCAAAGVDILFAPAEKEIYPEGFDSRIEVGGPARGFEAEARPGHFGGVALVVLKLFQIVQPHTALFGRKDAQQVAVIHRLVADLNLPVRLEIVPTAREPDGLACSSRNRFLDPAQRRAAPALYAALRMAASLRATGISDASELKREARLHVEKTPELKLEYLEVVDSATFRPLERADAPGALLIAAAACGSIRLIDNLPLEVESGGRGGVEKSRPAGA